jgi:hypothetical protein
LPVHEIKTSKKLKRTPDLAGLRELLTRQPIDHVVIEQVAARPGQGATSMFNLGFSAGAITSLVAGLQLPYSTVTLACGWRSSRSRRRLL